MVKINTAEMKISKLLVSSMSHASKQLAQQFPSCNSVTCFIRPFLSTVYIFEPPHIKLLKHTSRHNLSDLRNSLPSSCFLWLRSHRSEPSELTNMYEIQACCQIRASLLDSSARLDYIQGPNVFASNRDVNVHILKFM